MEDGRQAAVRGILFSDMVGSTALRDRLGDDRADALRRAHNALLGSIVTAHGGRVLRWTGDGLKADFATASAAVRAGLAMQRAVEDYGRRADAVTAFAVRIGVAVGEVVIEGNEAHGIAAIEAARLEPMAAPGEVLATELVRRLGHRRVDAGWEAVGSYALQGLEDPVDVVRVIGPATGASRPLPTTLVLDRRFPLVGRSEELGRVLARWTDARNGSGATVLVAGPSGIGKSRLVAQAADRAHADGALVLAGACDRDLTMPYQPFAGAFADAATVDDELRAAVEDGVGALGPLFPSRRAGRHDDLGPSDRYALFEAVVDLLDRLGRTQPVVLALADLHWAAASTVHLLRRLAEAAADLPLLVLADYRPDEVEARHPLRDVLAARPDGPATTRVDLGALGPDAVSELVAARVPTADGHDVAAFARRVHDESGGSPFFVCELLDHLTATGELSHVVRHGSGASLPLPDSVRDVVGRRLRELGTDAVAMLSTAAVVGTSFDLEVVSAVTGAEAATVLDAVEQAARATLVHETEAGRFGFAHALVRDTILDDLSASRRALAHRAVAEALEGLGRSDPDELAHHWLQAGMADRALASLERGARRDLDALAYESAAERYDALVEYHREHPGDDVALARAQLGRGLAQRAQGLPGYLGAVEEASRIGRRVGDVDIVADAAQATIWPGKFFQLAGRVERDLVALCEEALLLMGPDDPRRARVLATLAAHLSFDPDHEHRRQLLAEAEALARGTGDPELIGEVLVAEYLSLWNPTTFARRQEITGEISRMSRASGDAELEFMGGFLSAFGAVERGDLEVARSRLERVTGPATATQNPYFPFLAERLGASLDIYTGREGASAAVDALADRYGPTHADTAGTWAIQSGGLALQAGTLGDLAATMSEMVEQSALGANWAAAHALAVLLAGDHDRAAALLDADDPPLDYLWLSTVQTQAEVAVGLDDRPRCARLFDALLPFREQLGITASGSLCFGLVATSLGQLALALGDHDGATDLLGEAVERTHAMGATFESVKARRLLAAARRAAGAPAAEVEDLVAAARADAERHGFAHEAAELGALASSPTR